MFVVGGESLIDLISKPVAPDGTRELVAKAGGSPMNCAIALSKLGNDAGFLCPISTDTFGDFILKPLLGAGVRQLIAQRVREPSTLAVVTDDGKGNPRYAFYREADRAFTRDGLIAALPQQLELFQIGGFCTIEPADMAVWLEVAREAARRGATISSDPNLRPSLIADMDAYRKRVMASLELVSLVKMSEEDLAYLDAGKSIEQHAREILARPNCRLLVVTLG
ncbi:MAG TPA: PfkB family carbohydrate kinase, partial [Devosia sp.]|nr:PfkB family carbohydrate kinase [Devosia sp.]